MATFLIVGDCKHFIGVTNNIAHALEHIGHTVTTFEIFDNFCCDKSLNSTILNHTLMLKPDVILFLKNDSIHYSTLQLIKQHTDSIIATWWVDDPLVSFGKDQLTVHQNTYESIRFFDHFFVFDSYHIPRIKRIGCQNAHLLPCAYNPKEYFPEHITPEEKFYYGSDLSFVGTPYRDRGRILARLLEYNIKIWGGKWLNPQLMNRTIIDSIIDIARCRKIFTASKINLVLPQVQSINGYNQSLFQVIGTQAFALTPYLSDIEQYDLEVDKDVVTFSNIDELQDKIRYYLAHPEKRKLIATNGYKKMRALHTFINRAETMCQYMNISLAV